MSYLAIEYGPEKLLDWWRRDEGSLRSYSDDFRRVFGVELEQAWQNWIAWEHEFQGKNLASVREHPITPYRERHRRPLWAPFRARSPRRRPELYAAVRYPGRVPHLVVDLARGRRADGAHRGEGRGQYRVTSLAFDPEAGTLFYTTDNLGYRDLMALRPRNRQGEDAARGTAHRRPGLQPRPTGRCGDCAPTTATSILVRIPYPYKEWQTVHVFPYGRSHYDLDVSPDGSLVSTSVAELDSSRTGAQSCRFA